MVKEARKEIKEVTLKEISTVCMTLVIGKTKKGQKGVFQEGIDKC